MALEAEQSEERPEKQMAVIESIYLLSVPSVDESIHQYQ